MKKTVLSICLFAFGSSYAQTTGEYTQILSRYEQWKVAQYKTGNYETPANCKPEVVIKESYKGSNMGIPKDISAYFTDINGDGRLDGLISFNPIQCDGGNALMNAQVNLLILSKGAAYIVDDSYFEKIEATLKTGWISINGASGGSFYGTFTDYKDDDPRCCPSIKKSLSIEYKTKKLQYEDQ